MKRSYIKRNKGVNPVSKSATSKKRRNLDARDRKALHAKTEFCESCASNGYQVPYRELHHVRTKASHPELRHLPANHCALCKSCHDEFGKHPLMAKEWFIATRPEDAKVIGWGPVTEVSV